MCSLAEKNLEFAAEAIALSCGNGSLKQGLDTYFLTCPLSPSYLGKGKRQNL